MRSASALLPPEWTTRWDHEDRIIQAFKQYATVPVISMESAREHPCQGLADVMTIEEQFGSARRLPVALTWAPHH